MFPECFLVLPYGKQCFQRMAASNLKIVKGENSCETSASSTKKKENRKDMDRRGNRATYY